MFLFIIAGVVLSCMHQSALGTLLVIAPYKVHPLWYTPFLPMLFLMSAISVGFPMVIFASILCDWTFNRKTDMKILASLGKIVPFFLIIYLTARLLDLLYRDALGYITEGSLQSTIFLIECSVDSFSHSFSSCPNG